MAWFSRRAPAPPPEPADPGRRGPAPALPRTPQDPGVSLSLPAAPLEALAELLETAEAARALREAFSGVLGGGTVPGISGLRVVHRDAKGAVLRLGPPPGARWALRGVRAVAVLSGKLTLVDGAEALEARGGRLALVARPGATLFVEAGGDSAVALAVADPGFVATLA